MKNRKDYIFYIFIVIMLFLLSYLFNFQGVVISSLAYLLTCEIIKNR